MAGGIVRGEVRLCEFAPPEKNRPVVVLTRETAIDYLARVTIAPITAAIRGVPSQVILDQGDGMKSPCAVNLHNVLTVPKERLGKRVGQLSAQRMKQICAALRYSLGCDA